jgi:hypothetical protein
VSIEYAVFLGLDLTLAYSNTYDQVSCFASMAFARTTRAHSSLDRDPFVGAPAMKAVVGWSAARANNPAGLSRFSDDVATRTEPAHHAKNINPVSPLLASMGRTTTHTRPWRGRVISAVFALAGGGCGWWWRSRYRR